MAGVAMVCGRGAVTPAVVNASAMAALSRVWGLHCLAASAHRWRAAGAAPDALNIRRNLPIHRSDHDAAAPAPGGKKQRGLRGLGPPQAFTGDAWAAWWWNLESSFVCEERL
ncbi:hypothetical protein GCM10010425_49440 [Streptomyces spororaveus]|uniref:Uncharacterized protein n=1 Tax=Streptomyces spororaveus TaxID=284039 RepID=A0ABQ3T2C1_9ACTN|nr:hypothetical protein Sspor_00990 [Streptomyces spororaveus]